MKFQALDPRNIQLPELEKDARLAAPQRVFALFLDHFESQAKQNGTRPFYVQVGAHDGVLDDPMFDRVQQGDWDGLLLEPSSVFVSKLSKLYAKRTGITVQKVGISDAPGRRKLYRVSNRARALYPEGILGCASLSREHVWNHMARSQEPKNNHIMTESIKVEKLDTVLGRHKVEKPDLLLVDVEGHEKQVFEGLDLTKHRPRMINFVRVHIGRKDVRALNDRFKEAGYHIFRLRNDTLCVHNAAMTDALFDQAIALGAVPK